MKNENEIGEYERLRLENIKRNQKELDKLFPHQKQKLSTQQRNGVGGNSKRVQAGKRKRPREGTRRSTRVRMQSAPVEIKTEPTTVSPKIKEEPVVRPDYEELRASLAAVFENTSEGNDVNEDEWRKKSIEKWGEKILHIQGITDWRMYFLSRQIIKPEHPVQSPLEMLQERYCNDPWRLLISCCLMSRVSSAKTKRECIDGFFSLCPTPSAVLACHSADVENVIKPLGLFLNRYRSVLELSERFLSMPEFKIELSGENKIYGFGEFAFDSYLLFVKGMAATTVPKDRNLKAYAAWAKEYVLNK